MSSVYSDSPTALLDYAPELRPSASSRWFKCPGSVWLSEVLPPAPSGKAAQWGTDCHEMCRLIMGEHTVTNNDREMLECAQKSVDTVRAELSLLMFNPKISTEKKVIWGCEAGEIGGTADIVAYDDRTLAIVDYKFGTGVFVDITDNTQLMIYLVAARLWLGRKFDNYAIGILQPRIPGSENTRWQYLTDKELDDFEHLLSAAILRTRQMPPVFSTGDHCRWCVGKGWCPAWQNDVLMAQIAAQQFDGVPDSLNRWALDNKDRITKELGHFIETVEAWIQAGVHVPGYAVDTELGRRGWSKEYTDEQLCDKLAEQAAEKGISREDVTRKTEKPITITEAEKLGLDLTKLTKNAEKTKLVKVADSLKGF